MNEILSFFKENSISGGGFDQCEPYFSPERFSELFVPQEC